MFAAGSVLVGLAPLALATDEPSYLDAGAYALEFNVSIEEAVGRMTQQARMVEWAGHVSELYPSEYGGGFIDNGERHRLVLQVSVPHILLELEQLNDDGLSIDYRLVDYSIAELVEAADRVDELMDVPSTEVDELGNARPDAIVASDR